MKFSVLARGDEGGRRLTAVRVEGAGVVTREGGQVPAVGGSGATDGMLPLERSVSGVTPRRGGEGRGGKAPGRATGKSRLSNDV